MRARSRSARRRRRGDAAAKRWRRRRCAKSGDRTLGVKSSSEAGAFYYLRASSGRIFLIARQLGQSWSAMAARASRVRQNQAHWHSHINLQRLFDLVQACQRRQRHTSPIAQRNLRERSDGEEHSARGLACSSADGRGRSSQAGAAAARWLGGAGACCRVACAMLAVAMEGQCSLRGLPRTNQHACH